MPVIWAAVEADYFSGEDWTGQISLNCFSKLHFARTMNQLQSRVG
jgi:hypothetical protein